jgi:branched-chain amino acid transport system substrate-binding protein
MVEMLARAMEKARSADPTAVARALEGMKLDKGFQAMEMRAADHQVIQPLYVMEMDKAGTPGVRFDNEGSGFGFRTLLKIPAAQTAMPTTCQMKRPAS